MGDPRIIPQGIYDNETRRLVALVRRLDRMLAPHDCGNTAGYAMWRDQMASAIGVHELEVAGRYIDPAHDEPQRPRAAGGPVVAIP